MTIPLISLDNPSQNMLLHFTEFQERSKSVLRCLNHFQLPQEKSFQNHQYSSTPLCKEATSISSAVLTLALFQKDENKKIDTTLPQVKISKQEMFSMGLLVLQLQDHHFSKYLGKHYLTGLKDHQQKFGNMAIFKNKKIKGDIRLCYFISLQNTAQRIYILHFFSDVMIFTPILCTLIFCFPLQL